MNLKQSDYPEFCKFALDRYSNYTSEELCREFHSHGDLYRRFLAKKVLGENNGYHND